MYINFDHETIFIKSYLVMECDCLTSYRQNFEDRLLTFSNWSGKVNPWDLAKAGFYYTKDKDACECVYCHVGIYKWKEDDIPLLEHLKFNKNCPFVQCLLLSEIYSKKKPDKSLWNNVIFNILFVLFLYFIVVHVI